MYIYPAQPRMVEELYDQLLELADDMQAEIDGTVKTGRVDCPLCGRHAHSRPWPTGYDDERQRLDQALWSHAARCSGAAKKRKTADASGGSGGSGGCGGGGGSSSRGDKVKKEILKTLDAAQQQLDAMQQHLEDARTMLKRM